VTGTAARLLVDFVEDFCPAWSNQFCMTTLGLVSPCSQELAVPQQGQPPMVGMINPIRPTHANFLNIANLHLVQPSHANPLGLGNGLVRIQWHFGATVRYTRPASLGDPTASRRNKQKSGASSLCREGTFLRLLALRSVSFATMCDPRPHESMRHGCTSFPG